MSRDPDDDSTRQRLRQFVPRPQVSAAAAYVRRLQIREEMFEEPPRIGPYLVGRVLGSGGMGIVVRARHVDFPLDVALKLIDGPLAGDGSTETQREAWQAQVHREALCLKQVRGEHVVGVHEVGIVENLRWLAMTYIDGIDLEQWLKEQPTPIPWRKIVDKFVDAAEGLASIHAAGLVHGDFKPKNAVVENSRERVCVIDLGLARVASDDGPLSVTRDDSHERTETQHGREAHRVRAGTPAYMSPEQYAGQPLDARSDQFSFCLALYWALYGRFPFDGDEPTCLQLARKRLPRRPPGRAHEVPRWLDAALRRGLALAPERRFPSMRALSAELTRDRARPWWVGGGLVAAATVSAGVSFVLIPQVQAGTCGAAVEATTARYEGSRAALAARLPAAGLAALDSFHDRWRDRWGAACDGHFLRGEAGLELRHQCLDRQWQEFARLGDVLLTGDAAPAPALEAIRELPEPSMCDGAGFNRAKPVSVAQAADVTAARAAMADGRVRMWLGDYATARRSAEQSVHTAKSSGHAPTIAEALTLQGELARRSGKFATDLRVIAQAHKAAVAGRDVFAAVRATHEHARAALLGLEDSAAAAESLQLAAAHLQDIDWNGAPVCVPGLDLSCGVRVRLWAEHEDLRGLLAFAELDPEAARVHHTGAIVTLQRLAPAAGPELARALFNRGRALSALGEHASAWTDFEASTRLSTELFGPDHPDLAADFFNIADLTRRAGDYEGATRAAEEALARYQAVEGERSGNAASAEFLLGVIGLDRRDFESARRHATAARSMYAEVAGVSPSEVLRVDQLLAAVTMEEGDPQGADRLYLAVADRYAALGDEDSRCDEALARIDAGKCLVTRDPEEARARWADAAAALEAAGGAEVCPAGYELARARGELAAREDDHAAALRFYEEAVRDPKISDAVRADVEWAIARSTVLAGRPFADALPWARAAQGRFVRHGPSGKLYVQVIEAWLAEHR